MTNPGISLYTMYYHTWNLRGDPPCCFAACEV